MDAAAFRTWLRHPAGHRRTLVMGVLNVTPDSFSDGGELPTVESAVARARAMAADGASLLDIGGESTRPGSLPVPEDEQIRRVTPAIAAVRAAIDAGDMPPVTLSIDTTRARVAEAAIIAGAAVVNDVSAGRDDPAMLTLAAAAKVPIVLMPMQGTPRTMQQAPRYSDVTSEVRDFLMERIEAAQTAGVDPADVLIDPGIGFGKTAEHNMTLLRELNALNAISRPMVLGVSRKQFIGRIVGEPDASKRGPGTAATIAWCLTRSLTAGDNPGLIVRVHDVKLVAQTVRMVEALANVGGQQAAGSGLH